MGGRSVVAAFLLLAMFGGAALLLAARSIRDVHRPRRQGELATSSTLLLAARVWPFLLVTLLSITTYSMVQQVAALRLQDVFGLSTGGAIARAGAALRSRR